MRYFFFFEKKNRIEEPWKLFTACPAKTSSTALDCASLDVMWEMESLVVMPTHQLLREKSEDSQTSICCLQAIIAAALNIRKSFRNVFPFFIGAFKVETHFFLRHFIKKN